MKLLTALTTILAWLALTGPGAAVSAYTNPIFAEGQDPKLAFRDGWYYYVKWSHSGNINHIYRSRTLENLGTHRMLPPGIPLSVPVHSGTLNGHVLNKWFIFGPGVWACDGDPYDGNWTLTQPDIFNQQQFRLDYHAFFYKDELFLAWAGNEQLGTTGWWFESVFVSRVLYDGSSFSLETPVASTANMIATYSFGPGTGPRFNTSDVVVEAPAVCSPAQFGIAGRDDELFMLLAIDGAHTNYYAVGMIVFTGTTPAEIGSPSKWQKVTSGGSERLFSSHNPDQSPTSLAAEGLKGPGVVALAPAPDGPGLWMYYHSKHNDNFNRQSQQVPYDWIRRVMLQEIGWRTHNGRLIPDFFAKPIIGVGETRVPDGAALTYHFDSGTLDGWTDLTAPNTNNGPRHWAVSPPAFPGDSRNGSGAVGQHISGGTQDSSHPTLRLRSPEFSLDGSGDLSAWLKGGTGANTSLAGTAADALPTAATSPGFQGIALRNATTGQYMLSGRKTSSGDDWQQVVFSAAQLAALDPAATYTLELIDQGHGGWGWVAMDSVTIPGAPVPPEFAIHGGDRTVDSPVTVVSGSADHAGIASPMWFEVRAGTPDGPLLDFGAFAPQAQWAITVRHLRSGTNVLDVFARNPAGVESRRQILVTWPESSNPPARPRPVPADVWWGGLSNNKQLLEPARPWEFVKTHQDGYFFHSAGYGGLTDADKQALAAMLRPYRTKFCVELGGATSPDPGWPAGHFAGWGKHLIEQENLGLVMSDFTHDTHVELMEDFCRANPSWPAQDLVAHYTGDLSRVSQSYPLASGQWRDVFQMYYAARPHAKIAVTSSPIYWSWDDFPQLAGVWNNLHYDPLRAADYHPNNSSQPPVLVGGQPVAFRFNGRDIYEGFVNMSREIGKPHFELFSDVPWEFFINWGSGSPVLREKIRAYEGFLQAEGARHTLVCNASDAANQPGDADARDAYYKQKSLEVMFIHQLEGGRANRYLFESWYSGIPNTCAPETKEASFANLALTAIRYLKGIRDVAGTPETLTLSRTDHVNGTTTITLANTGSVACLPALTARHSGPASLGAVYQFEGVDVTAAMLGPEGFVPPRLLAPGETIAITCVTTSGPDTPPAATLDVIIEAFWNPQDPTGLVRDRNSFTLTPPAPAPLVFDFDDGTLQGWTAVSSDPRQFFAVTPPTVASPNGTPQAGASFIGLHIPAFGGEPFYTQDGEHATLALRSPEFLLNGNGDLGAWLSGGGPGSPNLARTAVSALPAASVAGGFRGIALRAATTGQFVLSASKTTNGNPWEQVGFSTAQLAALPQGHTYTLDLIDAAHGGWGWVNLDSVSIPGELVAPHTDPYVAWAATMGLAGDDAGFLANPDNDGIPNGIEFVLGGQPNPALADANSNHLLPTGTLDGTNLVFTYIRTDDSAYLNPIVEFATDLLDPWTVAVHGVNATITSTPIPGEDAATVTVSIPTNGAPTLFARLRVPPPPTP